MPILANNRGDCRKLQSLFSCQEGVPTQLILITLTYLLIGIMATGYPAKLRNVRPQGEERLAGGEGFKALLWKIGIGIGCLLVIDLASGGHPVWPALGLVAGLAGEVFPALKGNIRTDRIGIFYFGMVFYMYPATAVAALGIALPLLVFNEAWFLFLLVLTGSIPVLFRFSQVDPLFVWAAIAAELLVVYHYRQIMWENLIKKD